MPDFELFKLIMNGGMFGLWAIFVVWCLFYGAPMLKSALEKVSADSHATIADMSAIHATIADKLAKECREERREQAVAQAEEREEDRKARYELAAALQNAIARLPLR